MVALTSAQIPGFTGCPEYRAMDDFDMDRFTGKWFESQRYFQVLEVGTRCVATDYKKLADGKFAVANEMVTRLTGIKRVLEGELKSLGKSGEAKLSVKYNNLPLSFDTEYSILETDYDNYAVAWSCRALGPFSSTHAWVMTRKRSPTEAVLQRAYGVLDKYGISRTFFVTSDQTNCDVEDTIVEAPAEKPAAATTPARKPEDSFTAAASDAVAPIPGLPVNTEAEPQAANALTKSAQPVIDDTPVPVVQVVDVPAEQTLTPSQAKVKPNTAVPLPLAVAAAAPALPEVPVEAMN
ncbi:hypothetical protein J437_LFUL005397 [Ladona fulva]|uniref:Lipocalin/cytosolic fatty-acid binding domain-containing protein n=1 Tax=Ladona fulva TaxID=123851 RepID=A0A8K0K4N7_LADFU|nr:hypothetical protein J437_LFUL005397 [Ladona fulva]